MLTPGFLDGERRNAGNPACLVEIEPGAAEKSGTVQFQKARAHCRERQDGLLAGRQEIVELDQGSLSLPRRGRIQTVPDRFNATGANQLDHVISLDPGGRSGVNRELFNLGGEYPRLGPNQLDKLSSGVSIDSRSNRVFASSRSQGTSSDSRRPAQSIAIPSLATSFARLVVLVQLLHWSSKVPDCGGLVTNASRSLRYLVTNGSASSTMTSRLREKKGIVRTSSRTSARETADPVNRVTDASSSGSGKMARMTA